MITPRSTPRNRSVRDRKGFTLVELMVAIMLLSVGMLALAGSSAVVVKQMSEAGTMTIASAVARTRVENLRATPATCTAASNATATTRGVDESWTVTPMARSSQISVTVTYFTQRGNRSQTYLSMVPCLT